jgi:hypothetical protein
LQIYHAPKLFSECLPILQYTNMQELLVLLFCFDGVACKQLSQTYAHYNPTIIADFERSKQAMEEYVGKVVINKVVPVVTVAYTGEARLNLTDSVSVFVTASEKTGISFNKTF